VNVAGLSFFVRRERAYRFFWAEMSGRLPLGVPVLADSLLVHDPRCFLGDETPDFVTGNKILLFCS